MIRKPFTWLALSAVTILALGVLTGCEISVNAAGPAETAEPVLSPSPGVTAGGPENTQTPGPTPAVTITSPTETPTLAPLPPLVTAAPTLAATPTATQTALPTPTVSVEGTVLALGLNLREGPALAYPVVLSLPQGTIFTVLGQDSSGGWLFVALANGQTGWLDRSFTTYTAPARVVAAPPLPPTPTPPPAPVSLPTIQIVSPGSGSTYALNQQVNVQSVAAASAGVSQIQLLVDNAVVQTTAGGAGQQTLQANQQWTAATPGSHVLTVIAIDMLGNRSQPASISVNVALAVSPPQVVIEQPNQNIVVQAGQAVTIQSQATSSVGINRIELWADGQLYTTSTGNAGQTVFDVSQIWSSTTLGEHTLFVRAYDFNGQSTDSAGVVIGVTDTNPPQITVNISTNTVLVNQPVTVYTSASDSKGITSIELWADGNLVAVANSTSPVGQDSMSTAQTWQTDQVGQHGLYIIAHDSVGKSTQSSLMMVNVLSATTPTPTPTPQPTYTPMPTPTPQPTYTPRPTPTPQPTNTPRPTPTPQPTSTPTPQPTYTPRPTPTTQPTNTPTPTPRPTNTPRPTATPRPTNTPRPTPSPQPTSTPTPTPTPTPLPTNIPVPTRMPPEVTPRPDA